MMNTISGHDGGEMGHTCMPSFRPHTRLNRPCLWPLDPWVIGYYRNNSNWFLFVLFFRLSAIAPPRAENTNCGIWLWPVILCQHEKILTVKVWMSRFYLVPFALKFGIWGKGRGIITLLKARNSWDLFWENYHRFGHRYVIKTTPR